MSFSLVAGSESQFTADEETKLSFVTKWFVQAEAMKESNVDVSPAMQVCASKT